MGVDVLAPGEAGLLHRRHRTLPGAALQHDALTGFGPRQFRRVKSGQRIEKRPLYVTCGVFVRFAHVDEKDRTVREASLELRQVDVLEWEGSAHCLYPKFFLSRVIRMPPGGRKARREILAFN